MTAEAERCRPASPPIDMDLPFGQQYPPAPGLNYHAGRVSLTGEPPRCRLAFTVPDEVLKAFYADASLPIGTTCDFTEPGTWMIRHGQDAERPIRPTDHRMVVGGEEYWKRWGFPFKVEAHYAVVGGCIQVQLSELPKSPPVNASPVVAPSPVASEAGEEPVLDGESLYRALRLATRVHGAAERSTREDMLDVLRMIRLIEASTEHRLRRVKTERGEEWRWRAPDVVLEE